MSDIDRAIGKFWNRTRRSLVRRNKKIAVIRFPSTYLLLKYVG